MNGTDKRGLSLSIKFFLLTAIIIILLVGVTLLFSQRKATALANQTIQTGLEETVSTFETFQRDRYSKLKMINNVIAQNPYIVAYVEIADTRSILDQAQQRQQELRSDFIIVTDSEGVILARTDKPTNSGQSLSAQPLISQALEGEEVSGLWTEGGNLYNAVVLPLIQQGDTLVALLAVGYALNDTFAGEIKSLTHSETAIFMTPAEGTTTLVASTQSELNDGLTKAFQANAKATTPFQFELGPEKYIGVIRPMKNPDNSAMASFLAFRSLDRELFAFRQFQKNILMVGVGIMVLAFLISFVGAQRITGPLRHLSDVINEIKEGNYDVNIDVHSGDEVGVLANSFRRLLAELKEKAQLVAYLSSQPTMSSATGAMAPTIGNVLQQQATVQTGPGQISSNTLASLGAGSVIANRYEVQSVLGAGGMGVVLKAHDRQLDEIVALKMLKGEVFMSDPAALERFKQELKLARRITHRHVVRTYDYAELDTYYVISMEYVKGITLKQLVRQRGMLPLKIGLQIGKQICAALDAAHEKGVVHRDMKPQNVLLESSGDVKIMDFGIARVADMKGMTSTGTVMGTPDYMSPEQAQGLEMDHRTDIYSTGVVLFEIFTGKLPFIADAPLAVLNKHVRELPPKPTSLNPNIPPELERILLKVLAKNPEQRYQKIQELYDELDRISVMLSRPAVA